MEAATVGSSLSCQRRGAVSINIGGEKVISVHPDLFNVAGKNKRSTKATGCMEEPLDAGGNFFVDYSPEVFMPLIEWLRELRDAEPGQMVFAQPPHLREPLTFA